MPNPSTPSFFLTDAAAYDLALTQFTGLVLEAFTARTMFWDNTGNIIAFKSIDSGRSHQFIQMGDDPTPAEHTPGVELLGQAIATKEGTITVDDILVSHVDVPLDHRLLSHFDVMGPFAQKLGRSLAVEYDMRIARLGILAARTGALAGFHLGGNSVERIHASGPTGAYPATTAGANDFIDDTAQLAQLMDEDNVPKEGRYLFITPYLRRVLGNQTNIFDTDLSNEPNRLNERVIALLNGFRVVITNHIPTTNVATGPAKYQGDFLLTGAVGEPVALALCGASEGNAAIGFVQAMGITASITPDERRNTMFLKAQMMGGAGILAPYCAGYIFVDNA